MSPDDQAKALEKLSTFNPKVGYPDKWKDYSERADPPRRATGTTSSPAAQFDVADDRAQIGKPADRGRWGMTPPTSNAYYNPLLNEIVFPAGILQPPAFSVDDVDAVNYGAIGVVIGHEISHGFDDQGAQYDAQGRLQQLVDRRGPEEVPGARPCVVGPVRQLLHRARHPPQRQARARRERSATSRARASPTWPSRRRSRQGAGADHRRLHAGPAVLHRLGTVPRRRDPPGDRSG